jgi:hypothetical protein
LGIGDWGLGPIPNPQSPIPNPQSPIPKNKIKKFTKNLNKINFFYVKKIKKKYFENNVAKRTKSEIKFSQSKF